MNPLAALKRLLGNSDRSVQLLAEIREGIANLADVVNRNTKDKSVDRELVRLLKDLRGGLDNLTVISARVLKEMRPVGQLSETPNRPSIHSGRTPHPTKPSLDGHAQSTGKSSARLFEQLSATPGRERRQIRCPNDLASYVDVFAGFTPYSGATEVGFYPDWVGTMTDAAFKEWLGVERREVGGNYVTTQLPAVADGEAWFEYVNWVEAAREANGNFVMITLGACYGAQAVGSYRVLQMLNPMPCKLVAVEPDPDNQRWLKQHFLDNGINPEDHWLVGTAISDTREPVFFPVGAPGTGAQNSFSTNDIGARETYVAALVSSDSREEALRNLLLRNSTGLTKSLTGDGKFNAEIKLVSAVTLEDILSPFDRVDYVEVDIQQSEILVMPPFMDLLKKKVRRIHLGTHGKDVHDELARLFRRDGWEIVFDYAPNTDYETPHGNFSMNDGVLTVRNPDL